uniref:Large ribosomal subunit protein uL23c n=1 Tax=Euglena longa TaxID=3037 RepID=RK23_EUGLO|nr:ribosomal protein L23 [Euglena longa]P34771.1 RecName: Full=Large ribosomal subunit protein uL23c; AltName: Full=50S ribosomal protein L23, plastid [Euglena longa]CAC24593.1 ribosomal protein L23 [Euglena longa]
MLNFVRIFLPFLKYQVFTDKTNDLLKYNIYVFDVDKKLNKLQIKNIIEYIFNIKIYSINTYIKNNKYCCFNKIKGLKTNYKRAFIRLKSVNIIPYFSC